MLTWPGRFGVWSVEKFWLFLAWLRDLPRRIKDAIIYFCVAVKEGFIALFWAIIAFIVNTYNAICDRIERLTRRVTAFLNKKLDRDPSKVAPRRLRIKQRGRKIALFSRQLASMTQGGVGILQALDVLSDQAEDPNLGYVARQLATKLGQGFSLSKAASEFPGIFPPVYFHLLRVGESTGRLTEVIGQLADLLEREEYMLARVKSALSYPIFVMILTAILTLGLFSTVLPGFADFYRDFDVPLPAITDFLMMVTRWVQTPWFWIVLVISVWGSIKLVRVSWEIQARKLLMFQFILWLPLVGPIMRYSCLTRYCWVMSLTQEAGMDIIRAMNLASLASGNPLLEVDAKRIQSGITTGDTLSDLMTERPEYYPHLLAQLTMMGEETSQSSEAAGRAAQWYEQDVQGRIDTFQAALEPILMGLISTIVGTIVLAVFLPLYGLLDKLGV